jgi:hypothetical protein
VLGAAATAAMLVGWRSRTSTVVSWLCVVSLASFQVAFTRTWSHHNNLPLLVQLAFFGARCGDVWSVDAWLRQRRGAPPIVVEHGYQWSLRLAQLTAALMFFSAALAKLYFGHFTLAWALSDNLRHQLLARYDWIGVPRTALADWLIDDLWRYRGAAVLNLLAQTLPLAAAALPRRPWLRALAGAVFATEVTMLGAVMDLWNLHWLPLVAVFVDWDRLLRWVGRHRAGRRPAPDGRGGDAMAPSAAGAASALSQGVAVVALRPRARRAISLFVGVFLLYDALVAGGLDQRLRTYPFSAYPMFGYVRARRPYDQHLSYDMPGNAIALLADQPADAYVQSWIDSHHTFRALYKVSSLERLHAQLNALVAMLQQQFPDLGVRGARLRFATFRAPPYPAPAALQRFELGELGELRDGELRSALGSVRRDGDELVIAPRWTGIPAPASVRYWVHVDYDTAPLPLEVRGDGEVLRAPRPRGDAMLVVAQVGEQRYVVGAQGTRRW